MKIKKEIKQLRKIQRLLEDNVYPGYPFLIHGIIDMGDESAWINMYGRKMNLEKFCSEFDSKMCFHMMGSNLATKGSWATGPHQMQDHERFLQAKYDDFYIDNLGATQLYFATYAAIRECRGTKSFIFFSYDDDCEYANVQIFKDDEAGTALEKINTYLREYCGIDETGKEVA